MQQLRVDLPATQWRSQELTTSIPVTQVNADANDITALFNLFNKYLWITLWVVAMFVIIVTWFNLVKWRWDEKVMKQTTQTLIGLVIGILIAIFSYLIVRLAANLF